MEIKKFNPTIHSMRALVIVLIVFEHANVSLLELHDDSMLFFNSILYGFLSNTSILFVLISGFLFQHLIERYKVFHFYKTKIKNLLIPYVMMSLLCIVITSFGLSDPDYITSTEYYKINSSNFLDILISGIASPPYWYMPMILGIYLSSPFLVFLSKSKSFDWLTLSFLMLSLVLDRWGGVLNSIYYYLPVFSLGMLFCKYDLSYFSRKNWKVIIIPLYILFFIISIKFSNVGIDFEKIRMILMFLSIYLSLKAIDIQGLRAYPLIDYISNISFGIYFVHEIFNLKIIYFFINNNLVHWHYQFGFFTCLLFKIAITFVLMIASVLFIRIIKFSFKGCSKYIIGV